MTRLASASRVVWPRSASWVVWPRSIDLTSRLASIGLMRRLASISLMRRLASIGLMSRLASIGGICVVWPRSASWVVWPRSASWVVWPRSASWVVWPRPHETIVWPWPHESNWPRPPGEGWLGQWRSRIYAEHYQEISLVGDASFNPNHVELIHGSWRAGIFWHAHHWTSVTSLFVQLNQIWHFTWLDGAEVSQRFLWSLG